MADYSHFNCLHKNNKRQYSRELSTLSTSFPTIQNALSIKGKGENRRKMSGAEKGSDYKRETESGRHNSILVSKHHAGIRDGHILVVRHYDVILERDTDGFQRVIQRTGENIILA